MTSGTLSHDECQQALAEGWCDHPAVRDHLGACTACREYADALVEVDRLVASLAIPPPPPGLVERVLRAIREERQASGAKSVRHHHACRRSNARCDR
jgi:predicted anti-sigma-YlaC factor YlaD